MRATFSARLAIAACIGFALWLPADLWFFLAQRHSRVGQFAPFDAVSGVALLGRYTAANLLGGLPLYLEGSLQLATADRAGPCAGGPARDDHLAMAIHRHA